jgi:hypothetical protein
MILRPCAIARRQYLASVPENSGVAHTDGQGLLDLFAGFGVLPVYVQGPRVGIQRIDVVPPGKLFLGYVLRLEWLVTAVCIVRNQLAIRVVSTIRFRQRLPLKLGE